MSGRFLSAGDSVSDALAEFASLEIGEANDIDECVRAMAGWLQDVAHVVFRHAERLTETAIHEDIPNRLWDAGGSAAVNGDDVSDLTEFSLVRR